MTRPLRWIALLLAAGAAACSPELDWREFVPEGSGISVTFPCRTDRHARSVVMAGAKVQMEMLVCSAGDVTYAVSFVDVADPVRVSATLVEWREAAVRNVQGVETQVSPVRIRGMTPNDQAVRLAVTGRLPDGKAVKEHAAFFTHGLRVYAATVIGAKPAAQAVEAFLGGLRFPE
ncbi:MAG: hypothetical protein ABI702_09760 [Burkholderiales bacterium]